MTQPRLLLHVEGLALLVGAIALFAHLNYSWWWFAGILAPDLAMVGYAAGLRIGAGVYNAAHTTVVPIALGLAGLFASSHAAVAVALVWLAHIGGDRLVGYGLKYGTSFKDTHLQRL